MEPNTKPLLVNHRQNRIRHTDRVYSNALHLWDDACSYFEWVEANPILQEKVFCNSQGIVTTAQVKKARVMSIHGLCLFLGISRETFAKWSKGEDFPDFMKVCARIRDTVYAQKFEGAASDIFNASIIVRDLGLVDKSELAGPGGGPVSINTSNMSTEALIELRKALKENDAEPEAE